jgi:hypothetical protein
MTPIRSLEWGEIFSTLSSPGDRRWHTWQSDGVEGIGAELIGPIPETYFAPLHEGELDAFPEKAPDWVLDETTRVDSGDAASETVFEFAAGSSDLGGQPTPIGGVEFEALTGVPPHLRTSGYGPAKLRPLHIAEPRTPTALAARSCASCTSTIGDPRWRACPGCHLPVCADCVLDALLASGTGWCVECASERSSAPN